MFVQGWSLYGNPPSSISPIFTPSHKSPSLILPQQLPLRLPRKTQFPRFNLTCLATGFLDDIVQLAHNKVLVAAGISAAIGQLAKPFTSVLLYGKDFDIKAVIQAGGFPSTHSSAVVATATCIGLQRGFSDSIFGLTVVYAGLVMYDSQGVRREVGIHAKTLNKILSKWQISSVSSKDMAGSPNAASLKNFEVSNKPFLSEKAAVLGRSSSVLLESENKARQTTEEVSSSDFLKAEEEEAYMSGPLKESIGHTEIEVIAGALLGFLVALVVNTITL